MKNISPMTIGTVQLGMNYGIANQGGKPCEETAFAILRTSLENGINAIDTARAYGDSEVVIGRFLKTHEGERPYIATKIKFPAEEIGNVEDFVFSSVENSLERLGVDRVDAVMLHVPKDLFRYGQPLADAMAALLEKGYADQVGVSVYTAEEIEEMLKYPVFSVTQVPMSIFDQRLIADGTIKKLNDRNYTVFVRSVFLQGLFFLDPDQIDDPILVEHAVPKIRLLRQVAKEQGLSIAQLAIAFMRDTEGVTSLVLGADTPQQVLENIKSFDTPPLSKEVTKRLQREFAHVDIPEIMKVLSRPKK